MGASRPDPGRQTGPSLPPQTHRPSREKAPWVLVTNRHLLCGNTLPGPPLSPLRGRVASSMKPSLPPHAHQLRVHVQGHSRHPSSGDGITVCHLCAGRWLGPS